MASIEVEIEPVTTRYVTIRVEEDIAGELVNEIQGVIDTAGIPESRIETIISLAAELSVELDR